MLAFIQQAAVGSVLISFTRLWCGKKHSQNLSGTQLKSYFFFIFYTGCRSAMVVVLFWLLGSRMKEQPLSGTCHSYSRVGMDSVIACNPFWSCVLELLTITTPHISLAKNKPHDHVVVQSDSLWPHCSPTGSSVHGISQARILEWVAISSSRGYSRTKDQTCVSCIDGRVLSHWPPGKPPTWSWVLSMGLETTFLLREGCKSLQWGGMLNCFTGKREVGDWGEYAKC